MIRKSEPTYDIHSWDLAEFFMLDAPSLHPNTRKKLTHELAIEIQRTIEDWFREKEGSGWKTEGA